MTLVKQPSWFERIFFRRQAQQLAQQQLFLDQLRNDLDAIPGRVTVAIEATLRDRRLPCSIIVLGTAPGHTAGQRPVPLLWAHTAWLKRGEEREGGYVATSTIEDVTVIAFGAGVLVRVLHGVHLAGTTNLDGEMPCARIERVEAGVRLTMIVRSAWE